ncbi:hypothetical protein WR25_15301 [Diploscapter pachys]|uniref:Uncharacterized protein n=1 Tax=Diploscapter pachys TaxID=2018661 RepID=A0A2A2KFU2_9BILA|nr:hypothetical protein WR25_15301 [Diploscapter pachys]
MRLQKYITQFQQCVCKIPEGGNQCFEYDTRFLAVSIDEALVQFPNMASYNPKPLFQPSTETSFRPSVASTKMAAVSDTQEKSQGYSLSGDDDDDDSCNSAQCKACKLQIINGFIEDGPSDSENTTLWQEKQHLEAQGITPSCDGANQPVGSITFKVRRKAKEDMEEKAKERKVHKIRKILESDKQRRKRATTTPNTMALGIATQLGCNYKKGAELANSGFSGLCNLCWQWRKLPNLYFPNYINEIACDKSDDGCISGFGDCKAVSRPLNVLRNIGDTKNPRWLQVTIDANIACECQIPLNTPLHMLISS